MTTFTRKPCERSVNKSNAGSKSDRCGQTVRGATATCTCSCHGTYYFCGVLNAKIQQSGAAGSERSKPPACNNNVLSLSLGVYFELKGERYNNNSVVNILAIGEGSSALLCKTNKQDCCGTLPNRFGEFYYPHGARVSIFITGDGFYRNRGNQMIRLNRRNQGRRRRGGRGGSSRPSIIANTIVHYGICTYAHAHDWYANRTQNSWY